MEKFTKKQKGITLIALIITIIVMLILVAVTISVALNGELFERAKTASDQTQRQVSKEQLISAMVGAYDRNGNFVPKDVDLPEGAKWCSDEEVEAGTSFKDIEQDQNTPTNWVITENGNIFYVDSKGTVLDEKPEVSIDNLIPTSAQLAEAGVPINSRGFMIYNFDESMYISYWESESGIKTVNMKLTGGSYDWFCDEATATVVGMDACTWYKDGLEYSGPCPISLGDLQNPKNANGYITRIINSFSN